MPRLNFPVRWQAVLYRNYGMVADDKLAQVLGTDTATVRAEAAKLGLGKITYDPEWLNSGYITIIRNNWFLLDCEQLAQLLGWTEEKLDYVIKEEDFLYVKLGNVKPFLRKSEVFSAQRTGRGANGGGCKDPQFLRRRGGQGVPLFRF